MTIWRGLRRRARDHETKGCFMVNIILTIIGLLLEIWGAYYLSRGLFINAIRRIYFVEREIRKYPFGLRLACRVLKINQRNIENIILEDNVPEFWPQLTTEVKKVVYEPFYGFLLLLGGLFFQILALIIYLILK